MQQPPHNPYGRPPYMPPPQPPLLPHQRFWRWFRSRSKRTQILLCALIIVASIITCGSVANGASSAQPVAQIQSTDTPTDTPIPTATQDTAIPTDTPTDTPVPSPTATPKPKPTATPKPIVLATPTTAPVHPTPTPKRCAGVNNNPWCYDFNPGKLIYYPPSGFCSYFNCIPTFVGSDDPGDGYIIECQDGTYSQSGGESGACSYHGGEMRALYSH